MAAPLLAKYVAQCDQQGYQLCVIDDLLINSLIFK